MIGTGPTRSIPSDSLERASRQVVVLERVLLTSNDPRTGAAKGKGEKARAYVPDEIEPA